MRPSPIDILHFNNCSLFSSQEFKINNGSLHITDLSLGKVDKEVIPLDLIDPKPVVSKKNNEQLVWASITSLIIGMLFILLSISINIPVQQILGITFIGISALFLIASLKLQTTKYRYYYANTTTHLFTIHESQPSKTNYAKQFVQALNQRINKPEREYTNKTPKENRIEFIEHLEYLYNFGVITDMQYDRIQNKINAKIYGTNIREDNPIKSADIITLPITNSYKK